MRFTLFFILLLTLGLNVHAVSEPEPVEQLVQNNNERLNQLERKLTVVNNAIAGVDSKLTSAVSDNEQLIGESRTSLQSIHTALEDLKNQRQDLAQLVDSVKELKERKTDIQLGVNRDYYAIWVNFFAVALSILIAVFILHSTLKNDQSKLETALSSQRLSDNKKQVNQIEREWIKDFTQAFSNYTASLFAVSEFYKFCESGFLDDWIKISEAKADLAQDKQQLNNEAEQESSDINKIHKRLKAANLRNPDIKQKETQFFEKYQNVHQQRITRQNEFLKSHYQLMFLLGYTDDENPTSSFNTGGGNIEKNISGILSYLRTEVVIEDDLNQPSGERASTKAHGLTQLMKTTKKYRISLNEEIQRLLEKKWSEIRRID